MDLLRFIGSANSGEKREPSIGIKDVFAPAQTGEYAPDNVFHDAPSKQMDLVQAADYLKQIEGNLGGPANKPTSDKTG